MTWVDANNPPAPYADCTVAWFMGHTGAILDTYSNGFSTAPLTNAEINRNGYLTLSTYSRVRENTASMLHHLHTGQYCSPRGTFCLSSTPLLTRSTPPKTG